MRAQSEYYQMHRTLVDRFSHLRPAYAHGLALWVSGTLLAHSACESAVLAALAPLGKRETLRQRLRDLLCQCRQTGALPVRLGDCALLRSPARVDSLLVAGQRSRLCPRRDQSGGARRCPGDQRLVSRHCLTGRLARPACQSGRGMDAPLAASARSACARRAGDDARGGLHGSRAVESAPLARDPCAWLASGDARPHRLHLRAC
jgi:hypothetical protein